jgi:hypothetical protein
MKKILVALGLAIAATAGSAQERPKGGEFTATATVDTRQGTRSMGFTLVASSPMTAEEVQPLKAVLEKGGQQALLNAIRGSGRGRIKLGGFEYPVDLVVGEPSRDGIRYVVVTARSLKHEEVNEGRASLDYPFSVFVVDVPEYGTGDGSIYTQAALWVDSEGHVQAEQYDGQPGSLKDVRRVK